MTLFDRIDVVKNYILANSEHIRTRILNPDDSGLGGLTILAETCLFERTCRNIGLDTTDLVALITELEPLISGIDNPSVRIVKSSIGPIEDDWDMEVTTEEEPARRWIKSLATNQLDISDLTSEVFLNPISPCTDRQVAYQFTHKVFFATDFGNVHTLSMDAGILDQTISNFPEDWDILGELLCVCRIARSWSTVADAIWQLFLAYWDLNGHFTPSSSDLNDDYHKFLQRYHAIYVAGILCAIQLNDNAN